MRKILSARGRRRDRNVAVPPPVTYRSTSRSPGGRGKRRTSRVLLRPWLEGLLDREECGILHWVDREKRTFSIVWRHASRHGFDEFQHGDLFYLWAQHTGKLKRNNWGNFSNNKSTFRCALRSLKDCIELTKNGEKRGEGAKRTYQFIDSDHHLYNKKRKSLFQRRSKFPPADENSACLYELGSPLTNEIDYLSTETNSPQPSQSHLAAHLIMESVTPIAVCSHEESTIPFSIINDFKAPLSLASTSLPPITTAQRSCNSYPNGTSDQEQYNPNFHNFVTAAPEGSQHYSETGPNRDIPLTSNYSNYGDDNTCGFSSCKEEPLTLDYQDQDFETTDHQEAYDTTSIFLPKLNCGGNVKVQINYTESEYQQIDCSLIELLLQQQALLEQPPHHIPQMISFEMDNEISVEITSDIPIESEVITVEQEESITDSSFFKHNQTHDQDRRVLTELQPLLNDQSLAAMEAESNFDSLTSYLDHDVDNDIVSGESF